MRIDDIPIIEPDDFARRFTMRASGLMWLLGAGASASSGVPTAGQMIAEFKQHLYATQRHVTLKSVADLANPAIRQLLQSHIDAQKTYPALDDPEEYAALFEAAWPSEKDRRTYIDGKLRGAQPGYGHLALATLMKADRARIVWTTNFDALIADSCAKVFGTTSALTTCDLDAPALAREALHAQKWPVEIKLHGDFRSRRLKNTSDELRRQDAELRRLLVDTSQFNGLVVAGYSGRDASIMEALTEALEGASPFPQGLFWLHRGDDPPLPAVAAFLEVCRQKGVEAGLVRIENFDEALRDLIRQFDDLDTTVLNELAEQRQRWSAPAKLNGKRGFPVIRLNALPVTTVPTVCRKVVCEIGGYAELRAAAEAANVDVIIARSRAGVLAFGSDSDVRAMLADHHIAEFDLHSIEPKRLVYDSTERGLLRDAVSRAVSNNLDMVRLRKKKSDLLYPRDVDDPRWSDLRKLIGGNLAGEVEGAPGVTWREGVGLRLEWADGRLWLLFEPRIIFDGVSSETRAMATDFGRERTVGRYNRQLNGLLDFWANTLSASAESRALGIADGVDAVFSFGKTTAFSRRVRV